MADVTLSAKFADGTILRATGWIDIENWTNQDSKLTLSMHSRDNTWAVFYGSGDVSGSPRAIAVAGVTYNVLSDDDMTYNPAGYKNEAVMTSGGNQRKMTRIERAITGVTITANSKEYEALRQIAEG